jgi:SAM-dependent methyltransferase
MSLVSLLGNSARWIFLFSVILEIGSNDGTLLRALKEKTNSKLHGVDPAQNISESFQEEGIQNHNSFFDLEFASSFYANFGVVDVVIARNVLSHVPDIIEVMNGIDLILAPDGLCIIEFHEASKILSEFHYDSIYHEHIFYFTVKTLEEFFAKKQIHMFDCDYSPLSGGSIIAYFSAIKKPVSDEQKKLIDKEVTSGLNLHSCWSDFGKKVHLHKKNMISIMTQLLGFKTLAYGASARSSTLMNFCEINNKIIEYVIDNSPLKQGKYTAGTNIKIVSVQEVDLNKYDYILITAWNFKEEIISSLKTLGYKNKFIIPLPNITIYDGKI